MNLQGLMLVAMSALGAGCAFGADYATKGLVARWDAIENCAKGKHDPEAKKWIDLVGGKAFALSGVKVAERAFVFDGTRKSWGELDEKSTTELLAPLKGPFTVEYAFKVEGDADPKGARTLLATSPAQHFGFQVSTNTATYGVLTTRAVEYGTGTPAAGTKFETDPLYPELSLGFHRRRDDRAGRFKGEICAIRVYDRRLTDAEVAANAKLDAARFGAGRADVHVHAWGGWKTTRKAQCEQSELRERVCTACGEKQLDEGAVQHHWWREPRVEGANVVCACGKCRTRDLAPRRSVSPAEGDNAVRVRVTPNSSRRFHVIVRRKGTNAVQKVSFDYPPPGHYAGGCLVDEFRNIDYGERMDRMRAGIPYPRVKKYSDAVVTVNGKGWFGFNYALLPHFMPDVGLYRHDRIARDIDKWIAEYHLYPDRTFELEFRWDATNRRLEAYLDGSYAGNGCALKDAGGIESVEVVAAPEAKVEFLSFRYAFNQYRKLSAIKGRANAWLQAGAKLAIDADKRPAIEGRLEIWSPENSVDQGLHGDTHAVRSLTADPQSRRTPFMTGPEFMQWIVPNAFYHAAYVLCADIPQKDRVPKIGLSVTRFGEASVGSKATSIVSLQGAESNRNVKVVGKLSFVRDGRREQVPLYLVKVPLNPFAILQYVNDLPVYGKDGKGLLGRMLWGIGDYLDVEFVGAGTGGWNARSSVQIFGCSLARMDYAVEMDQSVRGNLFERGSDRPETGVKVTARTDNAKGRVRWTIYDPVCKTLDSGVKEFALAKEGDTRRLSFDLERKDVGWYGIDFTFEDAKGNVIGTHEASYTILAPDDREWGCDSPYAAWPLGDGYHNSDPNRRQQAVVMRKAGYRGSWQPPVEYENEFGWPLTCSNLGQGKLAGNCNPCPPCSPEKLSNHLDKVVAHYRDTLRKFPSCRFIQLLHEQGGRDIAPCLYDPKIKLTRGEYRGPADWEVYYCTEFAKRMRKEFPTLKIFLGNGSIGSEKIADLVRRGFDLDLVDQLGIESKGFATMPELPSHREAPGCLWALGETGRYFGYSNLTLNACNEYVFRPEGRVNRKAPPNEILKMAHYGVRDYILSLAHGCGIISSGHLEDCNDAYYDTNWGQGGQCTIYPFSYPKRMFTGLAVFTRVMDKAKLVRTVPTGGNSTYALEFRRERKSPDYAYVFWTPEFDVNLAVRFPADAKVRKVDFWGVESNEKQALKFVAGPQPVYYVSTKPVESVKILGSVLPNLADKAFKKLAGGTFKDFAQTGANTLNGNLIFRGDYGTPSAWVGTWERTEVVDPEVGEAINMKLVKTGTAPSPLLWEAGGLTPRKPITFKGGPDAPSFGVLIKGNGGLGRVAPLFFPKAGPPFFFDKKIITFDGWRMLVFSPPGWVRDKKQANTEFRLSDLLFGTGRKALNPVEMVDVENDLRVAGLYEIRNLAPGEKPSEGEQRVNEVMKRDVLDRDL